MKNLILSLTAFLFFGLAAHAQDGKRVAKTKAKKEEAVNPATPMQPADGKKKTATQSSKRMKPKQMKVQPRATAVPRNEKLEK